MFLFGDYIWPSRIYQAKRLLTKIAVRNLSCTTKGYVFTSSPRGDFESSKPTYDFSLYHLDEAGRAQPVFKCVGKEKAMHEFVSAARVLEHAKAFHKEYMTEGPVVKAAPSILRGKLKKKAARKSAIPEGIAPEDEFMYE